MMYRGELSWIGAGKPLMFVLPLMVCVVVIEIFTTTMFPTRMYPPDRLVTIDESVTVGTCTEYTETSGYSNRMKCH